MLQIVSKALSTNNITHSLCSNKNKDFGSIGSLERFKSDPDVRVLLLPLHLGAEGLDLIVASHVFLLEPLLNLFQESQAINRIVRIGQAKKTFVHKYIIEETIEDRIIQFQLKGQNNNLYYEDNNSNYNNNNPLTLTPVKTKLKRGALLSDDSLVLSLHDFKFLLDI